jgi:hypothetical protein
MKTLCGMVSTRRNPNSLAGARPVRCGDRTQKWVIELRLDAEAPSVPQARGGTLRRIVWALALVFGVAACAAWGFFVHRDHLFPYHLLRRAYERLSPASLPHRFHLGRRGQAGTPDAIDQLVRLPYLQAYRPATEKAGVRSYDRALAQDGLNFFTSGHAPVATLMDMNGTVVKSWAADPGKAFPGFTLSREDVGLDKFFRCARLTSDGGIVAMFDQIGLVRLDANSRLVWTYPRKVHHDLFLEPAGGLWVISREKRPAPDLSRVGEIWEDFVEELSPDGRPLRKVSLLEAFRRSAYAPLLTRISPETDIFHTNSLQVFDGSLAARSPLFRRGNILLSVRHLDALAILDPDAGKIVWALSGQWRAQHSACLLPSGRILLFDNLGTMRAASRVLEVDPFTQQIVWSFGGRLGEELLSETYGFVRRLSGGNTLVVESNFGRALEVTPDDRVVWEFVNPNRAGKAQELIALIVQMERVPRDLPFLRGEAAPSAPPAAPPR